MKLISATYELDVTAGDMTPEMCKELVNLGHKGLVSHTWSSSGNFMVTVSTTSVLEDICDVLRIPCAQYPWGNKE